MTYLTRSIEPLVKQTAGSFPAVVLTGPRQSGKTTLLRQLFAEDYRYISLDLPDLREAAQEDPRGFLELYHPPIILDEAQYAPELFHYIRAWIDDHRDQPGQFIITGSQNFQLYHRISESLAGRAAVLHLLPLTMRELRGKPEAPLPWQTTGIQANNQQVPTDIWETIVNGFYPEVASGQQPDRQRWILSFMETYLERDVHSVQNIGDLGKFRDFMQAIASRSGNLLNYSDLSREIGMGVNTVKAWMSVLVASFQVLLLRPWYANIGKQLIKTPKVYLTDTGLLCALLGIHDKQQLQHSDHAGAVFETAVVVEVYKSLLHQGNPGTLHFWRTRAGTEVDLLIEDKEERIAIEVKRTSTPRIKQAASIRQLMNDLPGKVKRGFLVHSGNQKLPMGNGILALPFMEL